MGISIWQKCLQRLEDELSTQQFNTCIKPLQVVTGNTEVKLLAPNKYIRDQINDQFLQRIIELVRTGGNQEVRLEIGSTQKVKRKGENAFAESESFYPLLDLNKAKRPSECLAKRTEFQAIL